MEVGAEFQRRITAWDSMSRWERSELGRDLRRLGLSYGEIMELIPVKKSTLATWCREVKLTEDQLEALSVRRPPMPGVPRNTQRKRHREIEQIRTRARQRVAVLLNDPFWVAGTILYWAEGAKTPGKVALANSDARALRLFIDWIRIYVEQEAEFSIQLHLHEGNDDEASRGYWLGETGLYDANFHKTFIKPAGTGHRKNHLEHGVCTIKLRRPANAWNTIMEWIDTVGEQFGVTDART